MLELHKFFFPLYTQNNEHYSTMCRTIITLLSPRTIEMGHTFILTNNVIKEIKINLKH